VESQLSVAASRYKYSTSHLSSDFIVCLSVKNGPRSHTAPNPVGARGSYPGVKADGAWSLSLTAI
jgi:hypothetical protein